MQGDSQFAMDEDWLVFHPAPSRPTFVPPDGAVDAHCHVFGPGNRFPYAETRKYTPCDAPKEKLWQLRDYLGLARNVIVQASCHGTDNRALVDALENSEGKARGVAVISPTISDAELEKLNAAGVRGVRFNFVKRLNDSLPLETLSLIANRVGALGWHIVVYFEHGELAHLYDFLLSLSEQIVVDHMGRPDVELGVAHDHFRLFMRLLSEGDNIWCKVTCPDRLSKVGPPGYDDVVPFAREIVESFPDRVLWGTDWPHPNLKSHMPDDGHLVDFIPKIATTAALQRKLLVDNPNRLYWPDQHNSEIAGSMRSRRES